MYFFVVCFVLADYGGVENFSEKIDNRKEEYERKRLIRTRIVYTLRMSLIFLK